MKGIRRNRILVWAMYFIAFFCMGPVALLCWTIYQVFKYSKEQEEYVEKQKPVRERKEIIKENKEENLTEKEKSFLEAHPGYYKIKSYSWGGTLYGYERK